MALLIVKYIIFLAAVYGFYLFGTYCVGKILGVWDAKKDSLYVLGALIISEAMWILFTII